MQIIAGKFKGRRLAHPNIEKVRATPQKVREAVFSIIHDKIIDAHFLDGFAGTGALGIEAASRGASSVTFIEPRPKILRQNVAAFEGDFQIVSQAFSDAAKRLKRQFDIIYLDPPWTQPELFELGLRCISNFDILAPYGWIVCEHHRKLTLSYPEKFSLRSEHLYGDIQLSILQ